MGWLTLVLRSTHSWHDKVGLLRFCFFLEGSDASPAPMLPSRSSTSFLTGKDEGDE